MLSENELTVMMEDNGKGFDPEEEPKIRQSGKGLGLSGMRERSSLIGGILELETAPGHGTTIYVKVPIRAPENQEVNR